MKPLTGVFPSTKDDSTFWLYENYTNALISLGALPLLIPTMPSEMKDNLFELSGAPRVTLILIFLKK